MSCWHLQWYSSWYLIPSITVTVSDCDIQCLQHWPFQTCWKGEFIVFCFWIIYAVYKVINIITTLALGAKTLTHWHLQCCSSCYFVKLLYVFLNNRFQAVNVERPLYGTMVYSNKARCALVLCAGPLLLPHVSQQWPSRQPFHLHDCYDCMIVCKQWGPLPCHRSTPAGPTGPQEDKPAFKWYDYEEEWDMLYYPYNCIVSVTAKKEEPSSTQVHIQHIKTSINYLVVTLHMTMKNWMCAHQEHTHTCTHTHTQCTHTHKHACKQTLYTSLTFTPLTPDRHTHSHMCTHTHMPFLWFTFHWSLLWIVWEVVLGGSS